MLVTRSHMEQEVSEEMAGTGERKRKRNKGKTKEIEEREKLVIEFEEIDCLYLVRDSNRIMHRYGYYIKPFLICYVVSCMMLCRSACTYDLCIEIHCILYTIITYYVFCVLTEIFNIIICIIANTVLKVIILQ